MLSQHPAAGTLFCIKRLRCRSLFFWAQKADLASYSASAYPTRSSNSYRDMRRSMTIRLHFTRDLNSCSLCVAQCVERRAFTPQDVQLAEEAEQDAAAEAALVALSSPKLELLLGSCFVLIPDAAVFPRTQANAASPLRLSPVLLRRQWAPIHRGCPFSHPVIQASMPVIRSYKSSVHSWCSDHIQPSGARYAARAAQVRRRCVRMRAFRNCYRAPLSPQTRADWDNKVIKCKKRFSSTKTMS